MTNKEAALIRKWRVDQGCSWRSVAGRMFDHKIDTLEWKWPWEPETNQIAGKDGCEEAAKFSDEDYMAEPWN